MDNKLQEYVDISLEKKLCSLGLLGTILAPILGVLIPLVGFIISLGGFVAYIIGIFKFSKKLDNGDIFKNFIYSLIIFIIGVILFVILSAGSIVSIFMGGSHLEQNLLGLWFL